MTLTNPQLKALTQVITTQFDNLNIKADKVTIQLYNDDGLKVCISWLDMPYLTIERTYSYDDSTQDFNLIWIEHEIV